MTPTLMALTDQLRREIDQMPAQMQVAAKYVVDHPGDFGLNPIRETADRIGISSNVLVRLAQRMGFDSFDAFRQPFRRALTTDSEDRLGQSWLEASAGQDPFHLAQVKFAQNEMNVVSRSLRLMDPHLTQRAIGHMVSARRCYVTATRSSHALAYYFHYAGRMAHPGLQLVPRHMAQPLTIWSKPRRKTVCLPSPSIHIPPIRYNRCALPATDPCALCCCRIAR